MSFSLLRWFYLAPVLALMLGAQDAAAQKFEGLAPTPPMGWNTWNTFAGNINEKLIKEMADAIKASGMQEAGYTYIVVDDCWELRERDENGQIVADPAKFPSGMKALGDYLHERGFKFGIHNCAGDKTCAGYPGGNGHEFDDAKTYASWGVDYLKYDWCTAEGSDAVKRYSTMRDAIRAAGRPIMLSICEWGQNKPWEWGADVGHLWRTTGDITDCWDCKPKADWENNVKSILDRQAGLEKYAGPGHWNDPDMLEAGNPGLTFAESRAHFSLWCILAAPLMAGNDVRIMTPEVKQLLTNAEVIAIDQDPAGKQGRRVIKTPEREVWVKPLAGGEFAVCALNASAEPRDIEVRWSEIPELATAGYTMRDLWSKQDLGAAGEAWRGRLDAHDIVLLRLKPTQK
ncbi:MAG TPA: glycoside hydrolase family 27 protein [Lacipirellulaceae bacterium]|nr:glycoside hydrolase family 27 protein [Lacipirellulaceae bacterium]